MTGFFVRERLFGGIANCWSEDVLVGRRLYCVQLVVDGLRGPRDRLHVLLRVHSIVDVAELLEVFRLHLN
jgi:hypothetical protein